MTILATIVVLGVLIFVHELGHFLAARSVGIRVERFSIGLGPRVWGYQRGDTEYVLSAIPLGGYVKMAGMADEVMERIEGGADDGEEDEGGPGVGPDGAPPGDLKAELVGREPRRHPADFDAKPVWARAWVISAGVAMNMAFAFLAYTAVAAGWGSGVEDTTRVGRVVADVLPAGAEELSEIPPGATLERIGDRPVTHWGDVMEAIRDAPGGPVEIVFSDPEGRVTATMPEAGEARARIAGALDYWWEAELGFVEPGSPAARGGLEAGDRVVAVDGEPVAEWFAMQALVHARAERETTFEILRDGGRIERTVTPATAQVEGPAGEEQTVGQVGVRPAPPPVVYTRVAPVEAVVVGWNETVFVTGFILDFLKQLVTGQVSTRNLGSIVTIGEASGQAAARGVPVFLSFMALFSINLAILNLLPIPVLDGGHLVFLGIEAVRGRPVSVEQRLRWSQVGFVILIGIMALALGNDFLRLFGM